MIKLKMILTNFDSDFLIKKCKIYNFIFPIK